MGTVVENFFRPSECVTVVGSFDSLRLTPHSDHDDSAFFDRRSSTGEDARHSIPAKHGGPGGKFLQAIGVRDKRGVVRLRTADAALRTMTGHFLIDAVRRARTPVTPFRQSMGDLV